jgi:YegS/Rv2252/BmrU family lipid kinase
VPASTLVILNQRAGATGRRFGKLEGPLRDVLGDLEIERTRGVRDAARIAREAVRSGVERLVVAGGDGTASEVVTGLLTADLGGYAEIGLLPLGSGCDFARSLGLARDPVLRVDEMARGERRRVDAGRIDFVDADGTPRTAYFLNIASFGISGLVDEMVNRAGKRLGPTAAFAAGTLVAILRHRPTIARIRIDERVVHEGPISLAAAANGQYFGSGMRVAPKARIDDGALDVVIVGGLSKPRLIANFPSIYAGTHLDHPAVSQHRGVLFEAEAIEGHAPLDVDGEPLGHLPVRAQLLPKAIGLFGLPPAPERH